MKVFLASRNAKKLAEMERILAEHAPGLSVVGLDDVPAYDEPVEDAPDFVGNALLKARAGFRETGLPSVADDSGLCVDALNGMPGVLSARWSGVAKDEGGDAANNALLLSQPLSVNEIWVPDPTLRRSTNASSSGSSKLKPTSAMSPALRTVGVA